MGQRRHSRYAAGAPGERGRARPERHQSRRKAFAQTSVIESIWWKHLRVVSKGIIGQESKVDPKVDDTLDPVSN
jgi:hypothetical protein